VAVCRPPGHHAEPPSASSADALRPPPSIAEQLSLAEAVCAVRGQGRGVFVSWAGGGVGRAVWLTGRGCAQGQAPRPDWADCACGAMGFCACRTKG
jgi:hypothetical protein